MPGLLIFKVYFIQLGIDSFAASSGNLQALSGAEAMRQLLDRIAHVNVVGLDNFGLGEHHRREFLDSAPAVILDAAAACTTRICLATAITVSRAGRRDGAGISAVQFVTPDLIAQGRIKMVVGHGSFMGAFPLFGLNLRGYNALFEEKLALLCLRDEEHVHWQSTHCQPDERGRHARVIYAS